MRHKNMCITVLTILFIICVGAVPCAAQNCDQNGIILAMRKPIYDFSVRFVHRISYGIDNHFVYSPLATWLQLVGIADGAQKGTRNEIWSVTGLRGYRKRSCYRRKFKEILNNMEDTETQVKRSSVVIVDKLFKVKKLFKRKVESLHSTKLVSLDFDDKENSAAQANNIINKDDISLSAPAIIDPNDFEKTVLVLADLTHFKSAWKYPFNKAQTIQSPFYFGIKTVGNVNMMNQVEYFKEAVIPLIGARVLELPFADERTSMLVYLPIRNSISDLYFYLQYTTLSGVLNMLKIEEPKAMNVSLPKFTIETALPNIPELLYDMGVKRVFYPDLAELKGITDSGIINISNIKQVSSIDVTESHVEANVVAESIITDAASDFNVNRPFAFMLVDKVTEIILFAGMYSDPYKNNDFNNVV